MALSFSPSLNTGLTGLPNPFINNVLYGTDAASFRHIPDVSSIHAGTQQHIFRLIQEVRTTGQQRSLFVWGEAGSGKTHLIARIRYICNEMPGGAVLAYVYMPEAGRDYFWTYLRRVMVTDLLQAPLGRGATPLECLLLGRLPGFSSSPQADHSASFLDTMRRMIGGDRNPAERITGLLRKHLPSTPVALAQAIGMLYADNEEHRLDAVAWLRGDQLAEEQLRTLRLPTMELTDHSLESHSREVVLGLCRLGSARTPLVIVYDQMDGFRDHPGDLRGFHRFGQVFAALRTEPGCFLLQVAFARTDTLKDIRNGLDHAHCDRVLEHQTYLPPLPWEAASQLITTRMNSVPELQALRQERIAAGCENFWPLQRDRVDRIHDNLRHRCTPRAMLQACIQEFNRACARTTTTPELADYLRTQLQRRITEQPNLAAQERLLAVLAGVPLLADLLDLRFQEVPPGHLQQTLPNANLLLQNERQQRWVFAACGYHPQLWRRLDRWYREWNDHLSRHDHCQRLVLVFDRGLVTLPPGTRQRVDQLVRLAGVSVVHPDSEALTIFEGLRRLAREADAGDLTLGDRLLESQNVCDWARSSIREPGHPLGQLRLLADDLGFDLGPPVTSTVTAAQVLAQ
ncbi:MAG: AAA family ATPase [Gemmataceae bacterium]